VREHLLKLGVAGALAPRVLYGLAALRHAVRSGPSNGSRT